MKVKTAIAAALAGSMGMVGAVNAAVVDDFTVGQTVYWNFPILGNNTSSSVAGPTANIMGGTREMSLSALAPAVPAVSNFASAIVSGGTLSYQNTAGTTSELTVRWDGIGNNALNFNLGANLLTGCYGLCTAFAAQLNFADLGFNYQLRVYTSGTDYAILTAASQFAVGQGEGPVPGPTDGYVAGPVTALYQYSWFATPGTYTSGDGLLYTMTKFGSGVDFSNVNAIELVINTLAGPTGSPSDGQRLAALDMTLGLVTTLPEPGLLALLGAGALGIGVARRRKAATAA